MPISSSQEDANCDGHPPYLGDKRPTYAPTLDYLPQQANTIFTMHNACSSYRRFLLPAVLAILAAAAFAVDIPIARLLRAGDEMPTVQAYLNYFGMFEMFGHGSGIIVLILVLHQLAPKDRWAIPRVALCALAAGGAADLLKMLIFRVRPREPQYLVESVWSTFGQWFPGICVSSEGQSFPSAHTATAAGLAAALIWLYPQGRILFSVLAALVGCQRIICGAHYPSDVLFGAATGCFAAQFVLYIGYLPPWLHHLEERWRKSCSSQGCDEVAK
jgi:undecaprenyl-diphosphatase